MVAGHSYEVEINFTNSFDSADLDLDATDDTFASFTTITTFTISAVPEPNSWSMIAGVLAIGFTGARRRRQTIS